jgi:hypothetical protein
MSEDTGTLCFQCGEDVGDPPRVNQLATGEPCPVCRRRLLDALPPLLPGFGGPAAVGEESLEPYPLFAALERGDGPRGA